MYDATGAVDVHICADAIPELFGHADHNEFKEHAQKSDSLEVMRGRFNVRGVLRMDGAPVGDSAHSQEPQILKK